MVFESKENDDIIYKVTLMAINNRAYNSKLDTCALLPHVTVPRSSVDAWLEGPNDETTLP